jgi:hypothetical protein
MGLDPDYRQPWSDVSIAFDGPPPHGRREREPTLISRPSLARDVSIQRELRDEGKARHPEELEMSERAMNALDSGEEFHLEVDSPEDMIPVIYTSMEYVDRSVAERMVAFYLATLGISNPRFEWIPPQFIAYPG